MVAVVVAILIFMLLSGAALATMAIHGRLAEHHRSDETNTSVRLVATLFVTMPSLPRFEHARFGDLLQLSTCLTWTVYTLASAGPVARNGALSVTTFATCVAALTAVVAVATEGVTHAPLTIRTCLSAAFLGFVCSGVAFVLWNRALRDQGPSRVGSMLYFEPFVTVAVAGSCHVVATCSPARCSGLFWVDTS